MYKRISTLLIASLFIIISCSDESDLSSISIGDNFISPQTHISLIDTFSVKLSTILIDSFPSSLPNNLLFGRYTDEYLGEISSTPYFQLDIPNYNEIDDDAILDSLTLVIQYTGDYYGDTLKSQTINVHEVLEEIETTDESDIYNTSSFKYSDSPIGSMMFTPKPNNDEKLEIKLENGLGETLLQMMKDNHDDILTTSDFLEFFKGVTLVPGCEDASILEFESVDSLIQMVLYTHLVGETRIETSYAFSMYSAETCFNSIKTERAGTLVENLVTQKLEIPSSETDEKAFIQGGTGIVTRIDFSGLNHIMELDFRYILYKAELILNPFPYSDEQIDFPKQIMLYATDKYNRLSSEIQDENDNTVIADFYYDELYKENIYYKFDITDYLINELSDAYFDPENGLIVSLPSSKLQSSAERLVFDARSNESFRPVLNLYFIFYN